MSLFRSLSGRLLLVTILVVMLIEVAIFVPSVSRFRQDYLIERIRRAEIAALTVMAAPGGLVDERLASELIKSSETLNIVVRQQGIRELVLTSPEIGMVEASYDLRDASVPDLIFDALSRIVAREGGVIRVLATSPSDAEKELEITLLSGPLRDEMRAYGWRIFRLSLIISLITAAMIFLSIRYFVVRPIQTLIENLDAFSRDPEDAKRIIEPSSQVGEIAAAEHALADMQREVHGALKARGRLAALGQAVAKISHDLRNILATAQLLADRLESSTDPLVARTGPKLIASLDRAIRLCQSTLTFGRAEEAAPERRNVALRALVEEAAEGLAIRPGEGTTRCAIEIEAALTVTADPEQLFRVLSNLMRNAVEALATIGGGTLTVSARPNGDEIEILVADTGPGMPTKALQHLFEPFRGGARQGGTGLGLAIAHELVAANGGTLELVSSTTTGTEFQITLQRAGHA